MFIFGRLFFMSTFSHPFSYSFDTQKGLFHRSWNRFQTCLVYNVAPKKNTTKLSISSFEFPILGKLERSRRNKQWYHCIGWQIKGFWGNFAIFFFFFSDPTWWPLSWCFILIYKMQYFIYGVCYSWFNEGPFNDGPLFIGTWGDEKMAWSLS